MSITASAPPCAAMLPCTRKATLPIGVCTRTRSMPEAASRWRACSFRKIESMASTANRSAPSAGRGISAGESGAATNASSPTIFSAMRSPR